MNNLNFFGPTAEAIFTEAGVTRSEAPEMFNETIEILANKMAMLSATMGLSRARMDAYDEQKASLVVDLKKLKTDGHLR